jgi:hypothetical protein
MSSLIRSEIQRELSPIKTGIVEFSESSEFCGKPLYPLQQVLLKLMFLEEMDGWEEDILSWWINGGRSHEFVLSPNIRERRDWLRDNKYDHFSEIDLVGGRRSSKGHITGLAGAYKLWKTRQIPDPAAFFGMDIDKEIEFSCIAASYAQAKTRQFADFYSAINRCKALEPFIAKRQEEAITVRADTDITLMNEMRRKGLKVAKDFAKFRVIPLAANADTLRGSASIMTVYDEMAFMMPGESRSSASECYTAIQPSLAQFGKYAIVFCNSSPYTRIGQFYEEYELAMRPIDHADGWYPARFAVNYPSWALFDKWWLPTKRTYKMPAAPPSRALMVSPDWPDQLDGEIEESKLDEMGLSMRAEEKLKEKANPDTYKVEYRGKWAEVLDAYLNPDMVDLAYSGRKPNGEPCGATRQGTYLHTYMAHCDPSSTTAGFGFAMGHIEEFEDMTGMFPDGIARHVVFDIVKRWNPSDFPGGTINYIKVRQELTQYAQLFRPVAMTFDQYNSAGLMQELRAETRKLGIQDMRISEVTATQKVNWNRWEAFKTALNLGLVHIPPNCVEMTRHGEFDHSEYSSQELKFLQEVQAGQTRRVEKQEIGPITTKDIADCIAEVTVKFLGSYIGSFNEGAFREIEAVYGSEGGYPVGGRQVGGPMGQENTRGSRFEEFYSGRGARRAPPAARGFDMRGNRGRRRG